MPALPLPDVTSCLLVALAVGGQVRADVNKPAPALEPGDPLVSCMIQCRQDRRRVTAPSAWLAPPPLCVAADGCWLSVSPRHGAKLGCLTASSELFHRPLSASCSATELTLHVEGLSFETDTLTLPTTTTNQLWTFARKKERNIWSACVMFDWLCQTGLWREAAVVSRGTGGISTSYFFVERKNLTFCGQKKIIVKLLLEREVGRERKKV